MIHQKKSSQELKPEPIAEQEQPNPDLESQVNKINEVGAQINKLLSDNGLELKIVHQTIIVPKQREE